MSGFALRGTDCPSELHVRARWSIGALFPVDHISVRLPREAAASGGLIALGPDARPDLFELGHRKGAAFVSRFAAGCGQGRDDGIALRLPDLLRLERRVHQHQQDGIPLLVGLDGSDAGALGVGDGAGLDLVAEAGRVGGVVARDAGGEERQTEKARGFVLPDLPGDAERLAGQPIVVNRGLLRAGEDFADVVWRAHAACHPRPLLGNGRQGLWVRRERRIPVAVRCPDAGPAPDDGASGVPAPWRRGDMLQVPVVRPMEPDEAGEPVVVDEVGRGIVGILIAEKEQAIFPGSVLVVVVPNLVGHRVEHLATDIVAVSVTPLPGEERPGKRRRAGAAGCRREARARASARDP